MSVNLAFICGVLTSAPELRVLASGREIATVQVTTRLDDGVGAISVPVAVWDPPAWLAELGRGDAIVVVGRVRRRFYRSGTGAAARVEVEAEAVGRGSDRRRRGALLRRARACLDAAEGGDR